mmetsp:Transcript_109076/g.222766  ORF Transcript_109076/g.222766 Transcript_109076/m.222766 type:complete len:247 (+) Transcript_109076:249-989(+)
MAAAPAAVATTTTRTTALASEIATSTPSPSTRATEAAAVDSTGLRSSSSTAMLRDGIEAAVVLGILTNNRTATKTRRCYRRWPITSWGTLVVVVRLGPIPMPGVTTTTTAQAGTTLTTATGATATTTTTTVLRTNHGRKATTTTEETGNPTWKWSWAKKLSWTFETNRPACHRPSPGDPVPRSTGPRELAATRGSPMLSGTTPPTLVTTRAPGTNTTATTIPPTPTITPSRAIPTTAGRTFLRSIR